MNAMHHLGDVLLFIEVNKLEPKKLGYFNLV